MRVACLGGGPAGLYFAIAVKLRDPRHDVVIIERNRPDDTFGWGVVLSDETLANLKGCDTESAEAIRRSFVYWDDIAVFHGGTVTRTTGTASAVSAAGDYSTSCRTALAVSAWRSASKPRPTP